MTNTIRVPIDTLEYTRDGLRTRSPLPLRVGSHNRIQLVRPQRRTAVEFHGAGFASGKSFPLPATLLPFWRARPVGAPFTHHRREDPAWNGHHAQMFGHSDAVEADDEKSLSERRARVGRALFLSDAEEFHAIADEEGWGAYEIQSMLRSLGCDPGPVDGKPERLPLQAAAVFAERFNQGVFESDRVPPTHLLPEPPELDERFTRTLRHSFLKSHGLGRSPDDLHPYHPAHGCCSYVGVPEPPSGSRRRLTVVCHPELPEYSENAPCETGNERSCAVVDNAAVRCMWFREHVVERRAESQLFDARWLWLKEDRYLLSVATTADDGEPVVFEVADVEDPQAAPTLVDGITRGGVASAVWASGHPHDIRAEPPQFNRAGFTAYHPAAPESRASAKWPRPLDLELIQLTDSLDELVQRAGGVRLSSTDGAYDRLVPFADALPRSNRHAVLVYHDVPSDVRVRAVLESGSLRVPLLEGTLAELADGTCGTDELCKELPPPPLAPGYDLDDVELDWTASVGLAGDHDELESVGEPFDE